MFQLSTDEVSSQSDIKKVVFEGTKCVDVLPVRHHGGWKIYENWPSFCLDLPFYMHQN
jgi:hypothetical protein